MKPKKLHLANSFKLRRYKKILEKINQLSDDYAAMSDEELQAKTQWFKSRLSKGERLQEILPEAYATIVKRLSASWGSTLTMYKS